MNIQKCPLCKSNSKEYCEDKNTEYCKCNNCSLIFVPSEYHLLADEEKKRYDLHQNDPNDYRYREFLNKIFIPMSERISENSTGLDFGCGPGPTLSLMFQESGCEMDIYDKFYAKNQEVFDKKYDFITVTEVIEHMNDPFYELQRLFHILRPNGVLGIMTKMVSVDMEFTKWYYKDDPTHICFFSKNTFEWIGRNVGLVVDFIGDDVILMTKKG